MDNKKVMVESCVNAIVSIDLPELRFSRTWPRKGARIPVDIDILKEAIYDIGVENMLKDGTLFIDDKDVRVELGLEEPDKEKIRLTDGQRKRYLTSAPLNEFKELLPQLSKTEISELVNYAIENEVISIDKNDILKKFSGRDVLFLIQMKRQKEEA